MQTSQVLRLSSRLKRPRVGVGARDLNIAIVMALFLDIKKMDSPVLTVPTAVL